MVKPFANTLSGKSRDRILALGRERERRILESWLEEAVAGAGGLGLISGPAGRGKTCLVRDLERVAAAQGVLIGRGTLASGPRAAPPGPWPRILRRLPGEDCAKLAEELSAEEADSDPTGNKHGFLGSSGLQAGRLATRLVDALASAAAEAPLLLALDDAHWLDPTSAEALSLVAEAAEELPILLIAVARTESADSNTARALHELGVAAQDRILALGPLGRDAIAEILGAPLVRLVGGPAAAATLTAGNPLLAIQLRSSSGPGADLLRGQSLEAGLSNLVDMRLATLDAPARRFALAVALGNESLDFGLLAEVLETTIAEVETRATDPRLAGLVVPASDEIGVELAHDLLRDALIKAIPSASRRALHARFAKAFIARRERQVPTPHSRIAHHACRAVPNFPAQSAAVWAAEAAGAASNAEAYSSARSWVTKGLHALALDGAGGVGDRLVRARLLAEGFVAEAVVDPAAALARIRECAAIAAGEKTSEVVGLTFLLVDAEKGRSNDPGVLVELLAVVDAALHHLSGSSPSTNAATPDAERIAGPQDSLRLGLLIRKAALLSRLPHHTAHKEAEELSMEALVASSAEGIELDDRATAVASHLFLDVFGHSPAERLELADELERIDGGIGGTALLVGSVRILDNLAAGRPEEADRAIDQFSRQTATTTNHPLSWYSFHLRAMRAAMRADVAHARLLLEASLESVAPADYAAATSAAIVLTAHLCEISGIPIGAVPLLPGLSFPAELAGEGRTPTPDSHPLLRPWPSVLVEIAADAAQGNSRHPEGASRARIGADIDFSQHWQAGYAKILVRSLNRPAEARAIIDGMASRNFADVPRDAQWLASICLIAETCFDLKHLAAAERILRMLGPFLDRHVIAGKGLVTGGLAAGFAAPLAFLGGDLVEAERLSDLGIAGDDAAGAIFFAARCRLERADFLYRSGDPKRRAEAQDFATAGTSAVDRYELGGLTSLVDRLHAHDAALAAHRRGRSSAVVPLAKPAQSGVFRRQGDVWLLRWQGEESQLRHQRGFRFVQTLLEHPHQTIHSRDLMADSGSPKATAADGKEGLRTGELRIADDSGLETIDAQALAAYRSRITNLRSELADAEAMHDIGRIPGLQQEIDAIGAMVLSSTGLAGRRRRTSSDNERARSAVRKRIKAALDRISRDLPALHAHLVTHIETGTLCTYAPDTATEWETADPAG